MSNEPWKTYWEAYQSCNSFRQVAREAGVNESAVRRAIQRAAKRGEINLTPYQNPPGYATGKVTVQAGPDGVIEREWRRIHPMAEDIENWVADLCEQAASKGPKIKPPKLQGDSALEIPIGDMHMGMYAWDKESGANWDTERAAAMFTTGCFHLFDKAKGAKHLVLGDLGDFLHSDNRYGTTEKSGNILDVDTRWPRVIANARDAWIRVIDEGARRFPSVHVIMTPGNHNPHAALWLAMVVDAWFRSCPHVTVDMSPRTVRYHRWGNTLLGYAHGHLIKAASLASKMATDAKADYAATQHHHWRQGHIHHWTKLTHQDGCEEDGVTAETFPILPPRDAYHAEKGYQSRRLLQGIVHHEKHGEVERHTFHARMMEEA